MHVRFLLWSFFIEFFVPFQGSFIQARKPDKACINDYIHAVIILFAILLKPIMTKIQMSSENTFERHQDMSTGSAERSDKAV